MNSRRGTQPYAPKRLTANSQSYQHNSRTSSAPQKPPETTNPPGIPSDLSFIVGVDELRPDFETQANRSWDNPQGFFLPPNRRDAYHTSSRYTFRYTNRSFQFVANSDYSGLVRYKAATVFSQATGTDHLLTVPFDARTTNVSDCDHDWRGLTFEHVRKDSSSTYASLECFSGEISLPAPVPPGWNQLIPSPYRYQTTDADGRPIPPNTAFAGLIGDLPLLVALAAFSAVPNALTATLRDHVRGGRWTPHAYTTGRIPHRGLAVTIYLDPSNPNWSTEPILDHLRNGDYGPFLRP